MIIPLIKCQNQKIKNLQKQNHVYQCHQKPIVLVNLMISHKLNKAQKKAHINQSNRIWVLKNGKLANSLGVGRVVVFIRLLILRQVYWQQLKKLFILTKTLSSQGIN